MEEEEGLQVLKTAWDRGEFAFPNIDEIFERTDEE
jgi:hypothetical protein